ncbi:MAG: hypothetical protein GEU91_23245 [Rhizobiales bacterium]|nr:hypothetical protein [Hyphomicrobiales bacterium]
MINNLIAGTIGIAMVVVFLGFMIVWVPAPPLVIIIVAVMSMLIYDFVQTLRHGENYSRR